MCNYKYILINFLLHPSYYPHLTGTHLCSFANGGNKRWCPGRSVFHHPTWAATTALLHPAGPAVPSAALQLRSHSHSSASVKLQSKFPLCPISLSIFQKLATYAFLEDLKQPELNRIFEIWSALSALSSTTNFISAAQHKRTHTHSPPSIDSREFFPHLQEVPTPSCVGLGTPLLAQAVLPTSRASTPERGQKQQQHSRLQSARLHHEPAASRTSAAPTAFPPLRVVGILPFIYSTENTDF